MGVPPTIPPVPVTDCITSNRCFFVAWHKFKMIPRKLAIVASLTLAYLPAIILYNRLKTHSSFESPTYNLGFGPILITFTSSDYLTSYSTLGLKKMPLSRMDVSRNSPISMNTHWCITECPRLVRLQ